MAVPQDNAIIAQASAGEVQENLSGYFHGLLSRLEKLQISLPSVDSTIEKIKQAKEQIGEAVKRIPGSKESTKLIKLKKKFNHFLQFGNEFLDSCQTMAEYASKEEHIQEINEKLKSKKFDGLKTYVRRLQCYLDDCKTTFETYRENEDDLDKYLSQTVLDLDTDLAKVKNQIENVSTSYQNAVKDSDNAAEKSLIAGEFAITMAGAGFAGVLPINSALAAVVSSLYLVYQGHVEARQAAVEALDREEELKRKTIEQKKLDDCLVSIRNFWISIQDSISYIEDMKGYAQRALRSIERISQDIEDQSKSDEAVHLYGFDVTLNKVCRAANMINKRLKDRDGYFKNLEL